MNFPRFSGVPAVRHVRVAEKQQNTDQQCRDHPLEGESSLPHRPREAGVGPDPIERPPDQGSGDGRRQTHQRAGQRYQHQPLLSLAQCKRPSTDASLGVEDQPGIGRHWNTTQRAHDLRCRRGKVAARPTVLQMRV
jgi:hypothetical protein